MTNAEREWFDKITSYGCVICRWFNNQHSAPERHHLLLGGKRMGHLFSIPLCGTHHKNTPPQAGEYSRHQHHRTFNQHYGTERELYDKLKKELSPCP